MNEHYLGVVKNGLKEFQACTGSEPMTSAKPVFRQISQYFDREFVIMLLLNRPMK